MQVTLTSKGVTVLTPDELLEKLAELGITISRNTLHRWTKEGLLPEPERGSLGRGRGRFVHYSKEAVAEAAAAWTVLRYPGIRPSFPVVVDARERALLFDRELRNNIRALDFSTVSTDAEEPPHLAWFKQVDDMLKTGPTRLHVVWLVARTKVQRGWPLEKPARVVYVWTAEADRNMFVGIRLEEHDEDRVGLSVSKVP